MTIEKTNIEGVCIVEPKVFTDERGAFVKPFNKDDFLANGMVGQFDENFFSVSQKNVIRGMHFQLPPHDHAKLIYVTRGAIIDVVLDLRTSSPTYGKHISTELSAKNFKMMYIPRGCAHGFLALEDHSYTVYLQETVRNAEAEAGIRTDSFGMKWGVAKPIVSQRDQEFPTLKEFKSPFK